MTESNTYIWNALSVFYQMVSQNAGPLKTHINTGHPSKQTVVHVQKVHNETQAGEEAMAAAIDDVNNNGTKFRIAAAVHGVAPTTLWNRT